MDHIDHFSLLTAYNNLEDYWLNILNVNTHRVMLHFGGITSGK